MRYRTAIVLNLCLAVVVYILADKVYTLWNSPAKPGIPAGEAAAPSSSRRPARDTGAVHGRRTGENGKAADHKPGVASPEDLKGGSAKDQPGAGKQAPNGAAQTAGPSKGEDKGQKPRESFEIIAQKNLFSPNRNPLEEKEEAPEEPAPEEIQTYDPESELMIYGTFIMGDYKSALVKVTGSAGKQKASEAAVGAMVSQYRITEIREDGITVEDPRGTPHNLNCARAKKEKKDERTSMPRPAVERPVSRGQIESPAATGRPGPAPRTVGRTREERAAILSELRKRRMQRQEEAQQTEPTELPDSPPVE